jgi:DNA-binding MarR family transcriptional regulator
MAEKPKLDSIEWMRSRWVDRGAARPAQFAAMASILRTTAVLTDELDRVLKRCGLNRTGYLVMITLQMSRDHTRPLGQLSKALLVHPTTVTTVVDQLEKTALVRRRPHPSDRRTILAGLTGKGLTLTEAANDALAEIDFGLRGISDVIAERMTADLRSVRAGLDDIG